jgi:hypothetical protein
MELTNVRFALSNWALSGPLACGASLMLLSHPLSTYNDFMPLRSVMVGVTNANSTLPVHIELRTVWTDINSALQTTPVVMERVSNTNAFGGSAFVAQSLLLLQSGNGAMVPYPVLAGSAMQVWMMLAASLASGSVASGQVTMWGI